MKNIGLDHVMITDSSNFTTDLGIKIRKNLNTILRPLLKLATKRKIILEHYPLLENNVPYIFTSTHSFDEDIISALSTIDRNAYVLIGTTNQIECNPTMYAAWVNGMIYVNRLSDESRKESVKKMERIINSGTSVLVFPEGGWNNTENLLVQKLFAGPYLLSILTGAKVVPISTFNEHDSKEIYIRFGEPMDLSKMTKIEALKELRDNLASMMYNQIELYSTPIKRDELEGDIHLKYMEARRKEYYRVDWTKDTWDEELTIYKEKNITLASSVRESFKNVEVNEKNAYILGPILKKIKDDEKYNFKNYMHKNFKK